jgi:hypothetical protein
MGARRRCLHTHTRARAIPLAGGRTHTTHTHARVSVSFRSPTATLVRSRSPAAVLNKCLPSHLVAATAILCSLRPLQGGGEYEVFYSLRPLPLLAAHCAPPGPPPPPIPHPYLPSPLFSLLLLRAGGGVTRCRGGGRVGCCDLEQQQKKKLSACRGEGSLVGPLLLAARALPLRCAARPPFFRSSASSSSSRPVLSSAFCNSGWARQAPVGCCWLSVVSRESRESVIGGR